MIFNQKLMVDTNLLFLQYTILQKPVLFYNKLHMILTIFEHVFKALLITLNIWDKTYKKKNKYTQSVI